MKNTTLVIALALLVSTWAPQVRADEILPAAAATEDLKSFDQSVVLPETSVKRGRIGSEISAEARRLKDQNKQSRSDIVSGTISRNGKASGGGSASESNPSNALRNQERKENAKAGKNSKGSKNLK